jgi:hypothetical protein
MSHPFDLANIAAPALDGIIRALNNRDIQTADPEASDGATRNLILSFLPRDVIDVTLSGQTVLFTALLADTARDVLHGMPDARKPRGISSVISMGRLVQGHLDRLRGRGCEPHRSVMAPLHHAATRPAIADPTPVSAADVSPSGDGRRGAPADITVADIRPPSESSWLDTPFEQWIVETPADLAAKAADAAGIVTPPRPAREAEQALQRTSRSAANFRRAIPLPHAGYPGTRPDFARYPEAPAGIDTGSRASPYRPRSFNTLPP